MVSRVGLNPKAGTAGQFPVPSRSAASAVQFSSVLEDELQAPGRVRFSAHALKRMDERGIQLTPGDQVRVTRALDEAAAKGARESVLLMDRLALVVNVPNRTVITAVPHGEAGDSVFTNIDSAVVVGRGALPAQSR
jgi:flagellar operon protein